MTPNTEEELAALVSEAKDPLRIIGGGTRPIGQCEGQVLSCSGLSGMTLYEPGALTIVVRAGTPLADLEAALAVENQRLPFEPMDHRGLLGTTGVPTIGGAIAANVSGPRRVQVGAARDFMLGVRFVDGMGAIIKNGGRVMKNVTGYDLVKLMTGSYGTLGVLTEVSLKVLPKSDVTGVLTLQGLSDVEAVAALSAALGSPFDVTGAAHAPEGPEGVPLTMIRVEGFEASVLYRLEQLSQLLAKYGVAHLSTDPDQTAALWTWVRDVEGFHGKDGDVWRISVKPSQGPSCVAMLDPQGALYDWGGGLVWVRVPKGTDVREKLDGIGGHATRVRGAAGPTPVFHPQDPVLEELSAGLRAKFDPRGILNQGLMG
ncbi:FAD-binding protein [Algirhabdus cladophorae]|uniref:FAD-binding protein n=1 Tax=Algirhabdus cladophorae TaxID=3377108 RepID=UPI003B8463DC